MISLRRHRPQQFSQLHYLPSRCKGTNPDFLATPLPAVSLRRSQRPPFSQLCYRLYLVATKASAPGNLATLLPAISLQKLQPRYSRNSTGALAAKTSTTDIPQLHYLRPRCKEFNPRNSRNSTAVALAAKASPPDIPNSTTDHLTRLTMAPSTKADNGSGPGEKTKVSSALREGGHGSC